MIEIENENTALVSAEAHSASLTIANQYNASMAIVEKVGKHYKITSPFTGNSIQLNRDDDFGVIPKTKKPSLYKSGAEKVCMVYNLRQVPEIVSCVERDGKDAFFSYTVRCNLYSTYVNPVSGEEKDVIFSCGYGSANTAEKRNGFNDAYNAQNSTLKMAQKRALTAAALAVSGLSSMFSQDIENEDFMAKADDILQSKPDSPVTQNQIKRIFAVAGDVGLTPNEAKQKLAAMGYASTKNVLQKDLENVIAALQAEKEKK